MGAEDARYAVWLDLVADLVRHHAGAFPRAAVADQLHATFGCQLSWNWMEPDGSFGMELHAPYPGFPTPEEADLWVGGAMTQHPLICWYGATGDPTPMSVSRVPAGVVPRDGFGIVRELLGPRGLDEQLSIPYQLTGGQHRAFVLARDDDYTDGELDLARWLQPLLALLARQAMVSQQQPTPADRAGLTSRELAVLGLLAEGLTAVAIAERLFISPRTVHSHVGSIYRKLRAPDRLRAVLTARDLGLLRPPTQPAPPDHEQLGLPQRWVSPRRLPLPPGRRPHRRVAPTPSRTPPRAEEHQRFDRSNEPSENGPMHLIDELNTLHDSYVEAVNSAVAEDDLERAERLAAAYDDEAWQLVAEREGKSHLLPLLRPADRRGDTPLRRLAARLRTPRAA